MTSQQSLKNKVNRKDYLRSLSGSWYIPAIVLVLLLFVLTAPAFPTLLGYMRAPSDNGMVSCFLTESSLAYYDTVLINVILVAAGAILAITQFFFVTNKPRINVFLSLGVKRKDLFLNRALAALPLMFASIFIPIFIIFVGNIAAFGMSKHLMGVFLYLLASLFTCAFSGYAIGLFSISCSGSIIESGVLSASILVSGATIPEFIKSILGTLLVGYFPPGNDLLPLSLISPINFMTDLNLVKDTDLMAVNFNDPFHALISECKLTGEKSAVPSEVLVDSGFIIPVIVLALIAAVTFVLAFMLFIRKEAENGGAIGQSKIASFLISAGGFYFTVFILFLMTETYVAYGDLKTFLNYLGLCLIGLVAYFVIHIILTRKIKATLKSLIYGGSLTVALAIFFCVLYTGVFGLYNKTPDKADLKEAAATISAASGNNFILFNSDQFSTEPFFSGSQSDIDAIISVFDKVKNVKSEDRTTIDDVVLTFRYKDGSEKSRYFQIFDSDIYEDYLKTIFNSSYYDSYVKEAIFHKSAGDSDNNSSNPYSEKYYGLFGESSWGVIGGDLFEKEADVGYMSSAYDGYYPDTAPQNAYNESKIEIATTEEFLNAVYEDFSKLTFDDVFRNKARPLCAISGSFTITRNVNTTVYLEAGGTTTVVTPGNGQDSNAGICYMAGENSFYVYPNMTEIIKYLKTTGIDLNPKYKIKEMYVTDSFVTPENVFDTFIKNNRDDSYYNIFNENVFVNGFFFDKLRYYENYYTISSSIDKEFDELTLLKNVYKEYGSPLKSVTDKKTIDETLKKCVPYYYVGDEESGKVCFVVYDTGAIMEYYIP